MDFTGCSEATWLFRRRLIVASSDHARPSCRLLVKAFPCSARANRTGR
jgi:hypothetical protein